VRAYPVLVALAFLPSAALGAPDQAEYVFAIECAAVSASVANLVGETEGQKDLAKRLEHSALQWIIHAERMQRAKLDEITDTVGDRAVVWRDRLNDPASAQDARTEALALMDVCVAEERKFPDEAGETD